MRGSSHRRADSTSSGARISPEGQLKHVRHADQPRPAAPIRQRRAHVRVPYFGPAIRQLVDDASIPRAAFNSLRNFQANHPKLRPATRHNSALRFADGLYPASRNQALQIIPENSPGLIVRGRGREISAGQAVPGPAKQMLHQPALGEFGFPTASAGGNDFKSRLVLPQPKLLDMRPQLNPPLGPVVVRANRRRLGASASDQVHACPTKTTCPCFRRSPPASASSAAQFAAPPAPEQVLPRAPEVHPRISPDIHRHRGRLPRPRQDREPAFGDVPDHPFCVPIPNPRAISSRVSPAYSKLAVSRLQLTVLSHADMGRFLRIPRRILDGPRIIRQFFDRAR
jgi:hypothetical protein